jgi:hypothetical protein
MPTLPPELQRSLDESPDIPVRLVDERTNAEYVLLRAEVYQRVRALFEEVPVTVSEQAALLRAAGTRAGWDDPEMDVYDNFRSEP